jgi:hypothetical protein
VTPHTELQVLDPVVNLIPVLVMHRLVLTERTTQMLRHDVAMFEDVLPVNTNRHVAAGPHGPTALPSTVFLPANEVVHLRQADSLAFTRAVLAFVGSDALPFEDELFAADDAFPGLRVVSSIWVLARTVVALTSAKPRLAGGRLELISALGTSLREHPSSLSP